MGKENEKFIVESFLNLNHNIEEAQKYIKESYNVNSEYNDAEDTLFIWTDNVNENLNLAQAKQYVLDTIGNEMINVMYGTKRD
jgi:hypothetical protein